MFPPIEDNRTKRFRAVFVTTITLVVLVGLCLESRKFIIASSLVEVQKYSVVGEFDPNYDKLFPRYYHATGLLTLPYDNIVEPFEAWYAGERNMSRIDYYHGMDKTIHRGDMHKHGIVFKIIPTHKYPRPSRTSTRSCWIRKVPEWDPIEGQSVIPTNLSEFQFTGIEYHKGLPCQKYVRKIIEYNKTNTYTFYISNNKPHVPIRYEMIGYDDLLTSHYDHYILDYITFHPWSFNFSVFRIPADTWCGKKALKIKSRYLMNPMSEFMHFHHSNDEETEKHFAHFKKYHMKDYKSQHENERRKHIFKHNLRFINARNRRNLGYKLAVNHFSDLNEEEMDLHRGLLVENEDDTDGNGTTSDLTDKKKEEKENKRILNLEKDKDKLPRKLDWRDYGAVTPVSSQGLCGSCWAFSIAGPIEAHHFFQTGKLEEVSKQQIIDCTWGVGNKGCRGGFPAKVFDWVTENGVATKQSYGPYLGQEAFCHCGKEDNCTIIHDTNNFYYIKPLTVKSLKAALSKYGPVSCSINGDAKTLRFYKSGIYNDPEFSRDSANHAMLCVGYGEGVNSEPYWLMKNTWGPLWGEGGYIRIARKGNIANIYGGSALAIKKNINLPEFPYQSLKKVKRRDLVYKKLSSTVF